ncbi:Kelch repeat-containing protein [Aquimarina agarilytica]|uniref:Kelch repeat-containing protein n=1 Tax=Aquimarina agarilytica TaxID=1087449 RepID=UPI000288DF22|nr:malectin domain-containing carbohydrate-binding protein [Aquimarina agarilytica]
MNKINQHFLASLLMACYACTSFAQEISFNAIGLQGESINNPTSLDFGPDGKLYVSQQNGDILQYDITRNDAPLGQGVFSTSTTNVIDIVKTEVPNHTDDGVLTTVKLRQVTGILTAGTAANPVIYVSSSDNLIGGGGSGNDKNLDTNSGVLSKLTWDGSSWNKIDLVRGLPRCEENHSTNGMDIFEKNGNTFLLLQQGGHTNKGAPSNNFVGTPEYYLSAALLIVNLTQLESMTVYSDPRTNTDYVYDLPTLNDPNRDDITNSDSRFPYPLGHPMYNATIDVGDPFGGDDGFNQAIPEAGGPVQVFSSGYRNAYDVVITENGNIYTYDNGPNTGWGGIPLIYDSNDQNIGDESTTTYNPENGDYVTGEFNESGSTGSGDSLHFVGTIDDPNGTYYAGHPNPIRAFPSRADIVDYQNIGGTWQEIDRNNLATSLIGISGYFQSSFDITDFPDDDRQGAYDVTDTTNTDIRILDVINSSTNGICEYTASNFSNQLQGNLFAASFNGNITRYALSDTGDSLEEKEVIFSGFGSIPLDIIALPDSHPYAGTIWAVTYGADDITIFEPSESGNCILQSNPDFDPTEDYDADGFTNQDEIDNGTNFCSAGSFPQDNDNDNISDLNDNDDDNDGILDVNDAFAIDPNNGTTTNLPIRYSFFNNDPGTGFFGLGFTGLMLDPSGNTDYLTQFDIDNLSFGGAAGKASIDLVSDGDPIRTVNNQDNAFQFGINVDTNSPTFTIHTKVESPFFGVNGIGTFPINFASVGLYIGNGDQDNYIKLVISNGTNPSDSIYGLEVLREEDSNNVQSQRFNIPNILAGNAVELFFTVIPSDQTAQPYISIDNGNTIQKIGNPINLPDSFLSPTDDQGMAVGIISTSFGQAPEFSTIWDFMHISESTPDVLKPDSEIVDFGLVNTNDGNILRNISISNLNDPSEGSVNITSINIIGDNNTIFETEITTPLIVPVDGEVIIPVKLNPNNSLTGVKNAQLEINYTGSTTPLLINLTGIIENEAQPLVRINSGGSAITNSQLNWESNAISGASSNSIFSVNTGLIFNATFSYAERNPSIPSYIDETTFNSIFDQEKFDANASPEIEYQIPIANGDYVVNFYLGNTYSGANQIGQRIFDLLLEGSEVKTNLDLVATFGHQVAGMLSFPVSVSDNILNIGFAHKTENPLINAIEVVVPITQITPLHIATLPNLTNTNSDEVVIHISATGGLIGQAYQYEISGQPNGIEIDPNLGTISGSLNDSPGLYSVTLTAKQENAATVSSSFTWEVLDENFSWTNKNEDENYTARHECSFVQAGENFILFGGRESAEKIEVYDYTNDSWSEGGSAPLPFNHFQAITHQGLVWVIGAFKTNSFPNEIPAENVYMYNPASEQWIKGFEIPESRRRGGAALVVHNNKFYIIGGNTIGHNGGYEPWLDVYDPEQGTWTILDDAPHARDHFQATVINNKIYAAGGRHSGGPGGTFGPLIPEVDVYDLITDTWSTLDTSNNLPTPRAAASVVNFNGQVFVIGGEGTQPGPAFSTVEAYNPLTNTWSTKSSLNNPRHGTQAIVSGSGIFTLGGSPNRGGGNQKNMEVYGADAPIGTPLSASSIQSDSELNFTFNTNEPSIDLAISLQNTGGNTATYLNNVTVSGTGFSLNEATNNILIEASGEKTINVTFTTTNLQSATGILSLEIDNNFIEIPINGSINNLITSTTSAKQLAVNLNTIADTDLKVFPNPSSDYLKIEFNQANDSIVKATLFDMQQKLISTANFNKNNAIEMSLKNIPSGLYFINILLESGETLIKKLVVD